MDGHSPSTAITEDDEQKCTRLTTWAISQGCVFHSLTLRPHPHYPGLGLFNSTHISCSTSPSSRLALTIPPSLIISLDTISEAANESDELAEVLNGLPELPTLEPIITVFLCWQIYLLRSGEKTKWSEYVEYLPRQTLLPMTWTAKEVEFLSNCGTSISHVVPQKLSFLHKIYNSLLQRSSSPGGGWFQHISMGDFILAESWVSSRTIESPITQTPMLVPLLDQANHSSVRNAAWEVIPTGGIALIREAVEFKPNDEICISYDLQRGTGERLYRYGFVEDGRDDVVSRGVTLFARGEGRVQGGNVFRFSSDNVRDGFKDLSFLTYENWYAPDLNSLNIIPMPSVTSPQSEWTKPHRILPPTEDYHDIRLEVTPPNTSYPAQYFETPDLESLLEALCYGDTFAYARECALIKVRDVVGVYRDGIWRPRRGVKYEEWVAAQGSDEGDGGKESEGSGEGRVRREVWEMVRLLCVQEGRLLDDAWEILMREIPRE